MSRIIYWNVRLWLLFRLIRYAWKLNEHEYDAMRPSRRGFANIKRADKMHMSAWYSVQTHGPFIRSLYVTSVPNTNRDVISDDGINYRKAPKREREREKRSIIRGFNYHRRVSTTNIRILSRCQMLTHSSYTFIPAISALHRLVTCRRYGCLKIKAITSLLD